MNRLLGKVALVTGAARGKGRSHALRLAEEGADIIAFDICEDFPTNPYGGATPENLQHTAKLVEALDRRIFIREGDVRDSAALNWLVADGVAEFGRLDIVVANSGIGSFGPCEEITDEIWRDVIDINLTGVFKTARAAIPTLRSQGTGGSIILTSSIAYPNLPHYAAAKHGVTGLMRALAVDLAPERIRVNSVYPTTVDMPMVDNEAGCGLFMGGVDATREKPVHWMKQLPAMPVPWVEAIDVSSAVLWLASDESRYVTGTTQVIDGGAISPFKVPHA
jgi:SDR family mycofactocin-dependent oxidoreductase